MGTRSCVAILDGGNILMVRQVYKGEEIWTLPGGSIREGETAVEAAFREVKEETNLTVAIKARLIEAYNERIAGMYHCFLGEIVEGEPMLGSSPELPEGEQELKEVRWFPLHEVESQDEIRRILPLLKL